MIGTIGKAVVKDLAKNEVNKGLGVNVLKSKTTQATGAYGSVKQNANAPMPSRNKPPRPPKLASLAITYRDMESLEKAAGWGDVMKNQGAAIALTTGAALGLRGAGNMYKKIKTERIWNRLKNENPTLTRGPKSREHFEVLQQFNPDVASNITTARSYMERMGNLGMVPHEFVGDLVKSHQSMHGMGVGRLVEDSAKQSLNTAVSFQSMSNTTKQNRIGNKLNKKKYRLDKKKYKSGVNQFNQKMDVEREKMQSQALREQYKDIPDGMGSHDSAEATANSFMNAMGFKGASLIAKMEEAYV